MPTQGSRIARARASGGRCSSRRACREGDILLITDSEVDGADLDLAGELRRDGFRVERARRRHRAGRADSARRRRLRHRPTTAKSWCRSSMPRACSGSPRPAADVTRALAPDDRDLDALFPAPAALPLDATLDDAASEEYEADVWRDRGVVLAVALLPLLALVLPARLDRGVAARRARTTPRARRVRMAGSVAAARSARLRGAAMPSKRSAPRSCSRIPEWRGAAQYRAGQFAESAVVACERRLDDRALQPRQRAREGRPASEPPSRSTTERSTLDPDHEDARYNRDLAGGALAGEPAAATAAGSSGRASKHQGNSTGESQSGEQQEGQRRRAADAERGGDSGDSQAAAGDQEQPEEPNEGDPQGEENSRTAGANAGEEADAAQAAAGPEDVEQWASEQAAEQWLRRIPQDPGGLLRRKFLYQYQRLGVDQDGNRVIEGPARRRGRGERCARSECAATLARLAGAGARGGAGAKSRCRRASIAPSCASTNRSRTRCAPRARCAAIPKLRRSRRSSTCSTRRAVALSASSTRGHAQVTEWQFQLMPKTAGDSRCRRCASATVVSNPVSSACRRRADRVAPPTSSWSLKRTPSKWCMRSRR